MTSPNMYTNTANQQNNTGTSSTGSSFLGGLLGPLLGGAAIAGSSALTKSAYDRLGDIGEQAVLGTTIGDKVIPGAIGLANEALSLSQFKPYTLTTGTGGTFGYDPAVDPTTGAITGLTPQMTLSDTEQAMQSNLMTSAGTLLGADPTGVGELAGAGQQLLGLGQQQLGMSPFGLAGQQQAAQQAFGLGGQFMGQAGMPMAGREQDVYDRIRATQLGEEERQRLQLEERLFNQGRGGVRTAMFGGTPEQMALAKAQEEAQNQASLMAITQAQAEQRQQADIGSVYGQLGSNIATQRQALEAAQQAMSMGAMQGGMGLLAGDLGLQQAQQQLGLGALGGSYIPQAQLLEAIQSTQLFPQLQQQAQLFGAGQYGETMMSGLEARLIAEQARANLLGGIGSGVLGGMFSPVETAGGAVGSLFSSFFGG
jgi:hypothetical protein